MSSNNKSDESAGLAIIMGGAAVVAMFLFMLAAFVALALTVVYIFALDRPYKIGKFDVTPQEAKAFILGGLAGVVILPLFVAFIGAFSSSSIDWSFLPHILLAGYTLGSFGTVIAITKMAEEQTPEATPEHPAVTKNVERGLPPTPPAPFQFASWDDEEQL